MFKKLLIAPVLLVAAFAAVVAVQPSKFRIERTAVIPAPPATVFAQVNDFHHWEAWSPWAKLDPQMKQTFEGPSSGVGAVYTWAGNKDVGEGRMTITDSQPNDLVRVKLEFMKPFEATNTAEFTFKPAGDGTEVTWAMFGENGFIAKAFCLVMNMDKVVGGEFEKGLANLKTAVAPK